MKNHTSFLFFMLFAQMAFSQWFWQLPNSFGGNLNDVVFVDSEHIVIVGSQGKVYRSEDGGDSWINTNSQLGYDINGVWAVNDSVVWAIADYGYAIKSEDKGFSWMPVNVPSTEDLLDIYFLDEDNGFAVGTDGIFIKTTDGGDNWTINMLDPDFILLAVWFADENKGWAAGFKYVGTSHTGVLIETEDGGENWNVISNYGLQYFQDIYFFTPYLGYIVGQNILKTMNGGSTWEKLLPADESCWGVDFLNINKGFIVGPYGKIKKTENGGQNWSTINSGVTKGLVGIDFYDEDHGFVCGEDGTILMTENGGSSWELVGNTPIETGFNSVFFLNDNLGWIGGSDGFIYHTQDGGANWIGQDLGIGEGYIFSIHFTNAENGWAVGPGDKILHTIDGGDNWTYTQPDSSFFMSDVFFVDPDHGWIGAQFGHIYRTSDGGSNWQLIDFPDGSIVWQIQFIDPLIGWAMTYFGDMFKTYDGGLTWTDCSPGFPDYYESASISFINENEGWASAMGEPYTWIKHTADGGQTWETTSLIPSELLAIEFINEHEGWAVGNWYYPVIAYTNDAGVTWDIQFDEGNLGLLAIDMLPNYKGWAVGDAAVLHTNNGGGVVVDVFESLYSTQRLDVSCSPNPASDIICFKIENLNSSNVNLVIYDEAGKLIDQFESNEYKANSEISVNLSDLPVGIYFYFIRSAGVATSGKFVHQ